MTVLIDERFRGEHGIGRYAEEIVSRLPTAWRRVDLGGRPASAVDVLNPRRLRLSRRTTLYSPGFSAGPSRCRQLLTIHDLIHLDPVVGKGHLGRVYYDRVVRPVVTRAGMVATVSQTSQRAIREWLDDPGVEVVDCGIGVSRAFVPGVADADPPSDSVLFVGNAKPHKNLTTLLQAMTLLPDLRLSIVTPDVTRVTTMVERSGLVDRTRIHSGLTDDRLAELYRGAACLALPSLVEGFGLPAAESLACGRPVVYFAGCDSLREIVRDDGVAFADPHDPRGLALAIEESRGIPISAGVHGERFSWDRAAAAVRAAVERLDAAGDQGRP